VKHGLKRTWGEDVLRKLFVSIREEMRGGWEKGLNEELHILHSLSNITMDIITNLEC
jgi:hypothetical protein